jgi:hypothetical protein
MVNPDENVAVRYGDRTVEYAIRAGGSMPAREFVLSLPRQTQQRILAMFCHVLVTGGKGVPPVIFKHEQDEIWTFKCKENKRRLRLPCFQYKNRWIVTHGFVKPPQAKWPEQEFTRAFEIMREVVEREVRIEKRAKGSR